MGVPRLVVVIVFAFAPLSASAEVLSIPVDGPAPAVHFKIAEPDKDGKVTLFAPIDFSSMRREFDKNAVRQTIVDGKPSRHIADIAEQASGMVVNDFDIDAAVRDSPGRSKDREAALEWLRDNAIPLERGAVTWRYTFPLPYNNLLLTSDWPSALSQADVIKALLLAARREDPSYRALALSAGLAYTVPCERGGLRCANEGYPWFEEAPLPYGYGPMTLNGHLYSVVMLHRLFDDTGDPRIEAAFREGYETTRTLLMHFDTGYWSAYDILPRQDYVYIAMRGGAAAVAVKSVTVSTGASVPSTIDFVRSSETTFPASAAWGDIGKTTVDGRELIGTVFVQPVLGASGAANLPITFGDYKISIDFTARDCLPPDVATFDGRARSEALERLRLVESEKRDQGCVAIYDLPGRQYRWSQVDEAYHDFHTRLVQEVWKVMGDAKFYTTAVRWFSYLREEKATDFSTMKGKFLSPVFDGSESETDDATILEALRGAKPSDLIDDQISAALSSVASGDRLLSLLHRAGVSRGPD